MPFRELNCSNEGLVGIGVDITERCNRQCATCFVKRTGRDMEWILFRNIVDQGVKSGFHEFYILGGEPGIRKDILEILGYVAGKFNPVILVTNMDFLANEKICQKVEETGVVVAGQRHTLQKDREAQKMEKFLTGGYYLEKSHCAWENVANCFPPNRVCVQCCITKPVVESGSIFEIFRWIREREYEPVIEFTKEGRGFKRGCELDVSPVEIHKVLQELRRIDREEFGLPGAELLSPQAYGKTCHMQETSIYFRVDGEAIPCVGFPELSYGNIKRDALAKILKNSLRQYIKEPGKWIYGYCRTNAHTSKHALEDVGGAPMTLRGVIEVVLSTVLTSRTRDYLREQMMLYLPAVRDVFSKETRVVIPKDG